MPRHSALRLSSSQPAGQRERQSHADQEQERRLDHVVEHAADPFHVRLVMAEEFPDRVPGHRAGHRAKRSTSAIIKNITSPRYASIDPSRRVGAGLGTGDGAGAIAVEGLRSWLIRSRLVKPEHEPSHPAATRSGSPRGSARGSSDSDSNVLRSPDRPTRDRGLRARKARHISAKAR